MNGMIGEVGINVQRVAILELKKELEEFYEEPNLGVNGVLVELLKQGVAMRFHVWVSSNSFFQL